MTNNKLSQVEDIHLVRDNDTGKSKGFCFLKYEDARSCILAVDNLIGTKVKSIHLSIVSQQQNECCL
jgi:RNA recognition motif-containing protein